MRPSIRVERGTFRECVDRWVRSSLDSDTTAWASLVASLPSVYPGTVLESLQRQRLVHRVRFPGKAVGPGSQQQQPQPNWLVETLEPTPHPLDSCWRFNQGTVRLLVREILTTTKEDAVVVLLGIPTLLQEGVETLSPRRLVLLDSDELAVSSASGHTTHSALRCDVLRDTLPRLRSPLVIADPPWYPQQMRAFLWAARHLCARGARVLMSIPPMGTRPGIPDEWAQLSEWAARLGLLIESYRPQYLKYLMPPFERNALDAAAVPQPPEDWRRGDLAVFRCVKRARATRPQAVDEEGWEEIRVQSVRVRVRVETLARWDDPALKGLVPGDVVPSVSRRYPLRGVANVWTSGNRAFHSKGAWPLIAILKALEAGCDPVKALQTLFPVTPQRERQILHAAAQLRRLVRTEARELGLRKRARAGLEAPAPERS